MSDDEYNIDFPILSPQDLAQIDALSQAADSPTDLTPAAPAQQPGMPPGPSLLSLFRSNRSLSVTDLVSPLWCEYQFSYSLHGRRNLPLALRPLKLELPSGKEITVNQEREKVGDKILKKGIDVHRALEKEIHPVEIRIKAQTSEEYMGLRLVNMFTGLRSMLNEGYTREFPVFGYLHNQHVTGIIDEIRRTSISSPSSPRKPSTQPAITSFFSPSKPIEHLIPLKTHTLHILDTKTRTTPDMPDTGSTASLSARLQLMMYKTLLDPLLAQGHDAFDFESYFISAGLQEDRRFGDMFVEGLQLLAEGAQWPALESATCLRDLAGAWPDAVQQLGADRTEDILEIVYRLQPRRSKRKLRSARSAPPEDVSPARDGSGTPPLPEIVETDTAPDVVLLSSPPKSMPGAFDGSADRAFSPDLDAEGDAGVDSQILDMVKRESLGLSPSSTLPTVVPAPPEPAEEGARILGSHKFPHSATQVDVHIADMLKLWKGERAMRGVDLEEVNRCWRCPYEDGCEWREMKAEETVVKARAKAGT